MDRVIIYPGQIPLDGDVLGTNRNAMLGLGYLAQATLGTGVYADGLACTPTLPASMQVSVGPGSITTMSTIDASAYGTLAADFDPCVKMGINPFGSTLFTLTAPGISGQSINYLIEAQLVEADGSPISLPYYNAANPAQPFTGPNNNQALQNTVRTQRVGLQLKAGAPANVGTQVTPGVDAGWVGLYAITVNFAQTSITSSAIAVYPGAPFIGAKIPNLAPILSPTFTGIPAAPTAPAGTATTQLATTAFVLNAGGVPRNGSLAFTSSGSWTVPQGVTRVKATVVGGGGGGSSCAATVTTPGGTFSSGGGGGAGGLAVGIYTVVPGNVITITIGAGGTAQGNGGTSSFGAFCSATGGGGSNFGSNTTSPGGPGGVGSGGTLLNLSGGYGSDGQGGLYAGQGNGAPGPFGGGGRAYAGGNTRLNAQAPGAGGGGAYAATAGTNLGGLGASGIVIIEF